MVEIKKTLSFCIVAFSSGENSLFHEGLRNVDFNTGIEEFKSKDYEKAIIDFRRAVRNSPSEPEPQIYLNNAEARLQASTANSVPFLTTVVVPIRNNTKTAKDILRGVAQAQTKFNEDQKKKSQALLEILIANDEDEPQTAQTIAKKILPNKKAIAIIGHESSETTEATLLEYENAGLAIISSTATSTELSSPNFLRIPSSNEILGANLAQYAKKKMNLEKVAIFYKSESTYSETLKKAFKEEFNEKIVAIDITESKDWKKESKLLVNQEVKAAVLFPSTTTVSRAIAIAQANAELPEGQRLQLLGGDTLYDEDILSQGGYAFEDLILVIPWQNESDYTKAAQERWKKEVGWRMAMSYDATQVITKVLSSLDEGATREDMLEKLNEFKNSEYLREDETSGEELCFDSKGESNRFARIRKVVNGSLQKIDGETDQEAKDCSQRDSWK